MLSLTTILFRVYWFSLIIQTSLCNYTPIINNITDITCSSQENCSVSCSQTNDCDNRTIRCPSDNRHSCRVICHNPQSCQNTIIMATDSTKLDVICDSTQSCSEITVHCPAQNHQKQNIDTCIIQINHNTNSNVTIYSQNGWESIKLLNYTVYNTQFSGTIFCKSNHQCLFDITQSSQCINSSNECNDLYVPNTTQIYQQTEPSTDLSETQKTSFWNQLSKIYFLWWIVFALIATTFCLICVLLIYMNFMRLQYKFTKELTERNRISQVTNYNGVAASSNSEMGKKSLTDLAVNQIKTRSVSQEIKSDTKTHAPLQPASSSKSLFMKKQVSVPIQASPNINNNPMSRSKSLKSVHFPQYSDIEMSENPSYHSSAKTITFKPRKESIPSKPSNINGNDIKRLSVLSGVSGSSKRSRSINKFSAHTYDSTLSSSWQTVHTQSQTQPHPQQMYSQGMGRRMDVQRQRSYPQAQHVTYNSYSMQGYPVAPIIPQHYVQQQPYRNNNQVQSQQSQQSQQRVNVFGPEEKMTPRRERNNKNLQCALEHLSDLEEKKPELEIGNINAVWIESPTNARDVLSLDLDQGSSGIFGMLPDVIGQKSHDSD